MPSAEQRAQHEQAGHVPFRGWRAACVMGRARRSAFISVGDGPRATPTVSVDYAWLSPDEGSPPLVVLHDSASGWVDAKAVSQKGPIGDAVAFLGGALRLLGYPRVSLHADREPAVQALLQASAAAVRVGSGVSVTVETGARGEPNTNAAAESTVGRVKGVARSLLAALRGKAGGAEIDWKIVGAWAVGHAALSLNTRIW